MRSRSSDHRDDGSGYVRPLRSVAEKINETYIGRVLRLTLLAPDIVGAILDGRQPKDL